MDDMNRIYGALVVICLFLSVAVRGQNQQVIYLSGTLVDESGDPAPYVNVEIKDGPLEELVVTDQAGKFTTRLKTYSRYTVTIDDPRYKHFTAKMNTGGDNFSWEVALTWRKNNSNETYLNADTLNNPINKVIKEMIRRRSFHIQRINSYTVFGHLYSTMQVTRVKSHYPRWWLWSAVPDSSQLGTGNLKEVYSKISYRNHPRAYKEEVQSIRTAGKELDLDFAAHELVQLNFYENNVRLLHYHEMSFISPIGWGAFVFYKYELIETYYYHGEKIYRIRVTPKNRFNRTFKGEIHISEKSYSLTRVDLVAPKSTGFYKVDSVRIVQEFKRISPQLWMPEYISMHAWNKLYGAYMEYETNLTLTDYNFKPVFNKGAFTQQVVSADTADIEMKASSWKRKKGYHITREEENYFRVQDSLSRLPLLDKRCIDSLSCARVRKFHWSYPIFGHTAVNDLRGETFYYDGLINDKMEFNTVEGFCYKYTVYYTKQFTNGWKLELEPTARFGFSDLRPKGKLFLMFRNNFHAQMYRVEGGSYYFQINRAEPIDPIINTFYTMFLRRNYMKLYRKEYIKFIHERELVNGVYIHASAEFANRNTLENMTNWSLIKWPGVNFTPNNPNAATDSNYRLVDNKSFLIKIGLTYKPRQRYMRFGRRKVILGSMYPVVSLFYTKGIPVVFGSQVNYDLLELSIAHDLYFRVIGKSSYIFKAGIYLNKSRMTFLDYTHFIGERGYFLGSAVNGTYLDQFRALDYFAYSTNSPFIEIHYQHDFKGFLLNQVPGMKILKWNPLVGANYLQLFDADRRSYLEIFVGIDNLFGAVKPLELFNIRVDVAMQIKDGVDVQPQFLLGIATNFGKTP